MDNYISYNKYNISFKKHALVNTNPIHDIKEIENIVDKVFLKNRHKSYRGVYIGHIFANEIMLYVIEHNDATIGAYFHDEISEFIKVEVEIKK